MDEKLKQILERSTHIFLKYGIRNVSMDDISRDLGISKKTLYQYVENKTDLLEKIFDLHEMRESESYCVKISSELNAIDELLEVSKIVSDGLRKVKGAFTFEIAKFYPQIHEKYFSGRKQHVYEKILKNIENGISEGFYRPDLNKELVARLYVQKLEDVFHSDFVNSAEFSYDKVFEVMFENHIRGISNQKGIDYFEKQKQTLNFKL